MGNIHKSYLVNARTDTCKEQSSMSLSIGLRPLLVDMVFLFDILVSFVPSQSRTAFCIPIVPS